MLGKTILICLIKDTYFTHIVVFIMKLWEVATVLSPEISTDISIPGSVCPFCLSPRWSEKAPSCSLPSQHSQDSAFGQQTWGFWTHASDSLYILHMSSRLMCSMYKHTMFTLCFLHWSTLKFGMCQTCGSVKILFVIYFYNPETLL